MSSAVGCLVMMALSSGREEYPVVGCAGTEGKQSSA